MALSYRADLAIDIEQFRDLLQRSGLAQRRPVGEPARLAGMLKHANVLLTCWQDNTLVGLARGLSDFHYACYLSDLAVCRSVQRRGIGRQLLQNLQRQLQPGCKIILLAAPQAQDYYQPLGFVRHERCWIWQNAPDE